MGAVVRKLPQRHTGALQPPDRVSKPGTGGVVERNVVQPRDSVRLRTSIGRFPGVEPEVMVVATRGHEQYVSRRAPPRHVPRLGDNVEAEHADIEVTHPVDVGDPQVHVADADARIDRIRRRLDWRDVALDHGLKLPGADHG